MSDLLGPHGSRPLSEPPAWLSNVADDHTPVEFSLAYSQGEPPALRLLGEALGSPPGPQTNMSAGEEFIDAHTGRLGLSTARLDLVRDLFATDHPQGTFGLWCSLVFRRARRPELKIYLNPEVKGVQRAPHLVGEALHRLGLAKSYQTMLDHAVRPDELGRNDRLSFFALDLHDGPQARVKLYLSHHHAEIRDVVRAAGIVDGVDPTELAEFCAAAGGANRFDSLPLVGSYTLTEGADAPVGYSIYVPIRGYVNDDREARDRVVALLARHGFDSATFDQAVAAVTQRSLRDGVGLIAHVSLRLGPPRPGVTVYLSAEAYQVKPPRPLQLPAARRTVARPAARRAATTR
ncbi:tryptophan dimethylallyltransferase family protein [Allorhizocola rhizosphaerae]|uniref:tryptophan dimethylallyltransferase family protein n=1 Tax=Allorhizocola rhizosphaerae TaxID=1872709 RepID=UPI001FE3EF8E|nr:tryptophan dimethylallyltransferase family protein [Allorhizocola rhizosphaerae]